MSPNEEPGDRAREALPSFVLIFAAWLVPALLSGFDSYMQSRLEGHAPDWHWVFFSSIDWLLYAVLTPFVFHASRRWPLEGPHQPVGNDRRREAIVGPTTVRNGRQQRAIVSPTVVRNIALHIAGAFAMCAAWAALGTLLRLAIFPRPPDLAGAMLLREFVGWLFTTLPFGFGVYFALVGIEHSRFYFAQARERETQAARLAAQLAEARLGALRMQLNPHFLFNSLNAITVLVRDRNTADAARMLELLSDVLRQVLRTDQAHERPLAEELDFLERYLAI